MYLRICSYQILPSWLVHRYYKFIHKEYKPEPEIWLSQNHCWLISYVKWRNYYFKTNIKKKDKSAHTLNGNCIYLITDTKINFLHTSTCIFIISIGETQHIMTNNKNCKKQFIHETVQRVCYVVWREAREEVLLLKEWSVWNIIGQPCLCYILYLQ